MSAVTARSLARRVLERVAKGAWATLTLDAELERSGLAERDRRLASELVYGVLRHRTRIDRTIAAHANLARTPPKVLDALRLATYQLVFLDRIPPYAAVDDAVSAARAVGGAKLASFTNAVLRKVSTSREPPLPQASRDRVGIEHSLPAWIVRELAAALHDDEARIDQVAAAFAQQAPLVARVNARKTTRDELAARLVASGVTATPIGDATPMALALDDIGDPSQHPTFRAGEWTVQDTGAQLVAITAAPRDGQRILDACAGVGGKSTHLAELADVAIDAADLSKTKLEHLMQTATRLGLTSITPRACDLSDPEAPLAATYDLVLLDAPCSGLGVLRRHPDAKWRLDPADVPRLAVVQAQLLDAVASRVAPGGALVYSVCTFTRAEGPEQIRAFAARSGMRIVAEHHTWPPDADAFYLARLER